MRTLRKAQQGFTLIELLVALTLGLLISAAALQLFVGAQQTYRIQSSNGEIQDSVLFGLDVMQREIKLANLGNGAQVHDRINWGGLVLTTGDLQDSPPYDSGTMKITPPSNLRGVTTNGVKGNFVPRQLVTVGPGMEGVDPTSSTDNQWKGVSNVYLADGTPTAPLASDQLVIQYRAPQDGVDCEGKTYKGPSNKTQIEVTENGKKVTKEVTQYAEGEMVIERFYLKADPAANNAADLALYCDAGRYSLNNNQNIKDMNIKMADYGDAGQLLIPRVDQFHVLLITLEKDSSNVLKQRYRTISDYMAINPGTNLGAPNARPRIIGVQIGLLLRSTSSVSKNVVNTAATYSLMDQNVKVVKANNEAIDFMRSVYVSNILFRNGRGTI